MDDRRKHPRIDDRNSVAVTVLEAPAAKELEGQTFFCLTDNVSEGGIMLHVSTDVPIGSQVELRIAFAHPIRSFDITGRIAWIVPADEGKSHPLGVEFVAGKANDLDSWREIVRRKVDFRRQQGSPESSDEPS